MRIIFDTNIYLAALKEHSLSSEILETIVEEQGGYFLYISPDIKTELYEKLQIWEAEKLPGFENIKSLKFNIDNFIPVVFPKEKIEVIKEDPDDNKVLECAVAADANLIITMDKDLLRLKIFRNVPIVHPKTFKHIMPHR